TCRDFMGVVTRVVAGCCGLAMQRGKGWWLGCFRRRLRLRGPEAVRRQRVAVAFEFGGTLPRCQEALVMTHIRQRAFAQCSLWLAHVLGNARKAPRCVLV